jgi:HD-GYP domain-containing protein (c-di-GMP phosphodiesterase class II)
MCVWTRSPPPSPPSSTPNRRGPTATPIVVGLANALGGDLETLRDLRRAALLHDIGKLAISNRILDKPGPLTKAEFARIREHPVITERILARVPGCERLAATAGAHHERLDGSGYPRGLSAADLTRPARLLAVADVYEALTSARPYRPARSSQEALTIIRDDVPERLDAEAVAALERRLTEYGTEHLDAAATEAVLNPDGR